MPNFAPSGKILLRNLEKNDIFTFLLSLNYVSNKFYI